MDIIFQFLQENWFWVLVCFYLEYSVSNHMREIENDYDQRRYGKSQNYNDYQ